jgi:hypothetical protein
VTIDFIAQSRIKTEQMLGFFDNIEKYDTLLIIYLLKIINAQTKIKIENKIILLFLKKIL